MDTRKGAYIGVANVLNDETRQETNQFFIETTYKKEVSDLAGVSARAYYDHHATDIWLELYPEGVLSGFLDDGMIGSPRFKTKSGGAEVQADFTPSDRNTLTAGALYEHHQSYDVRHVANFHPISSIPIGPVQDISSWGNFNQEKHRIITAAYLQDVWKFSDEVEGTFGVRYDHYSDFGDSTNPRIGVVWNFIEKGQLKFLYGSAFRAPNFIELYNANNPVSSGNEDLSAEEIDTYEVSAAYRFNDYLHADISFFRNNIRNLIGASGSGATGRFQNEGKAQVDGIETELKFNLGTLGYGYLNHTYQDAENPDTGECLRFVAMNKGNLGINISPVSYTHLTLPTKRIV